MAGNEDEIECGGWIRDGKRCRYRCTEPVQTVMTVEAKKFTCSNSHTLDLVIINRLIDFVIN